MSPALVVAGVAAVAAGLGLCARQAREDRVHVLAEARPPIYALAGVMAVLCGLGLVVAGVLA